MGLSGQQRKKLATALIDAFPTSAFLEQMLSYELDKNLKAIAGEGSLQEIVFRLIQVADSQGWVEDLVRGAHKENRGNSELAVIALEFFSNETPQGSNPNIPQEPNNQEQQKSLLLAATLPQNLLGLVSKLEILIWEFISQFKAQYYQHLIYTYRTYRTQGLKTPGAFAPDLDKVFIPLRMSSKSPIQMSQALIQKETFGDLKIWDFLAKIRDEPIYKHIVVIAPPGYGKTTLLEHLTLTYAQDTQRQKHSLAPRFIPVLLYLRKIRERITNSQPPNLAQLVTEVVKESSHSLKLNPPLQWFEDRLKSGKCLVMLDGLDEVAGTNERQQVSQWVDTQIEAYPETTFILTSRPYGYIDAQLTQQTFCLEIQPFNLKQMEEFVNNWYLQNETIRQGRKEDPGVRADARREANDLIGRIKQNSALASMALNPLLLTMIATVHDNRGALPGSRSELYAEICEVLLARRQEVKGINYPIQLKAAQLQSVLQVLALNLMQQKTREFNLDVGKQIIEQQLQAVAPSKVNPEFFFKHIEQVSGLLLEKQQGIYEFAHKSFQEYLTAIQVKDLNNEQILLGNINDSWWDETIRLYSAKSDTTNLIRAALKNPNVISLSIAYDCLLEGMSVAPAVRQELEFTLEAALESAEREIFQLAAQVKLRRRLSKLVRIDDQQEIDNDSYITYAEYQLFLDETGEPRQPQHWSNNRFPPGDAKKTISGIRWEDANRFCVWLKLWSEKQGLNSQLTESVTFYRLPTQDERNQYPINDDQKFADSGIRLVKFQLPLRYSQLANYLLSGEWKKADKETFSVMLQVSNKENKGYLDVEDIKNFPCDDLRRIDELWVYASKGHFGFSVQRNIYQSLGGRRRYSDSIWRQFVDQVGWREENSIDLDSNQVIFDATIPRGHLPYQIFNNFRSGFRWDRTVVALLVSHPESLRLTPISQQENVQSPPRYLEQAEYELQAFEFEVIRVDAQARKIERIQRDAQYFKENLGNNITLEMVAIPGGKFLIGSPETEARRVDNESPQHEVDFLPFFIGKYPVTQAQWRAVAALPKVDRELNPDPSHFKGDNLPVEQIIWYEALEFCARLSRYTQRHYRFPSEAEWEYACRAGTTTPFHLGETITPELVNYDSDDPYSSAPKKEYGNKTTPVGSFKVANAFGLYDMHGNVWEWCADNWHDNYEGAPTDGSAWIERNENNGARVLRGSSWYHPLRRCRSARRSFGAPNNRFSDIGFRVVVSAARV